jgi:hypothetical protein
MDKIRIKQNNRNEIRFDYTWFSHFQSHIIYNIKIHYFSTFSKPHISPLLSILFLSVFFWTILIPSSDGWAHPVHAWHIILIVCHICRSRPNKLIRIMARFGKTHIIKPRVFSILPVPSRLMSYYLQTLRSTVHFKRFLLLDDIF